MGTGFKGGAASYHSISQNVGALKETYSFRDGYFGIKGQGRSFVRNIKSDDPVKTAKDFYDKAGYGGIEKSMSNGKGMTTKMADGTILSYRKVSTSDGSPAVEINIHNSRDPAGLKYQKIHFVRIGE